MAVHVISFFMLLIPRIYGKIYFKIKDGSAIRARSLSLIYFRYGRVLMDSFLEKIVVKKKTAKDYLIMAGVIFGGMVLFFVIQLVPFLSSFFLIITAAIVYLIYQVVIARNVEFEYIVTNGDLDIDKIIARKRRKRIFSANCKDFDIVAKLKGGYNDRRISDINKRIEAVSSIDSDDVYLITLVYKGEKTAVLFEPDERMLKTFKFYIPRKVEI